LIVKFVNIRDKISNKSFSIYEVLLVVNNALDLLNVYNQDYILQWELDLIQLIARLYVLVCKDGIDAQDLTNIRRYIKKRLWKVSV